MSSLFSDLLVGNINCLPSFLALCFHTTSNFKPRKSLHFTNFIKMATLTCSPLNAQGPIGLDDFLQFYPKRGRTGQVLKSRRDA